MNKIAFYLPALMFFACSPAISQQFDKEISGFSSPESIVSDGEFLYVSNVGNELKPTGKDGDGFISKMNIDGEIIEQRFLPATGKLDAPKGMAIVNHVLYVADIDRVVGFNILSKEQVFELDFSAEKTAFCNAFAVKDENTLYLSATDVGKIYEITIDNPSYKALALPPIKGANGLLYESGKLYVVGFGTDNKPNGEFGVIDVSEGKPTYQKLSEQEGYFDGIARISDTEILWSDWVEFEQKGVFRVYDSASKTTGKYDMPREIGGPAGFWLDSESRMLYIPAMMEGKALFYQL